MIQLTADSIAELDDAARENRQSRAAFTRATIEAALAERRRQKELQQVIDAFRTEPPEDLTVPKRTVRAAWPD
jgi:hypothetical protein